LKVETRDDIARMLRDVGYSEGAVKEILKWYEKGNVDSKT